jgi:putative transcriptional regulator
MTIKHHLSDALLSAYAAGALPEAFSLVIATHVSLCDDCRARLGAFEAVGGALLDRGAATDDAAPLPELSPDSLQATMARIAALEGQPPVAHRPVRRAGLFPAPLSDYAGDGPEAVKWRAIGGGVRQAILSTTGDAVVRLLHIPGGVAVPDHGHRGTELTLVLQGAFRDETDRFGPGDIEIADQSVEHTPVAEPGVDCICLAATDAPLRFNALLPRLAQRFLRI